jgi:hypothetical protein
MSEILKCSNLRNLNKSPDRFISEMKYYIPTKMVSIIEKIQREHKLSYKDVFVIIYQLLPPSCFNDWPDVDITTPLRFPESHSFNLAFSKEWFYMNINGFLKTGERFYILRFTKRVGTVYKQGLEGDTFLLSDCSTCTIIQNNGTPITFRYGMWGPCISGADPSTVSPDMYYIQQVPFKLVRGGITLIELDVTGSRLIMNFGKDGTGEKGNRVELRDLPILSRFSYHIESTCVKPILLQGKNMNGLDPGSEEFISKITGTSYMYYSWPSWRMDGPCNLTTDNVERVMDETKQWNLWLDHQGGNVKDSKYPLLSQFAMIFGMRPSAFPGWNWFSLQFFKGDLDNVQWTGYSNKPWNNNTSYNKQQLQGTWSDKNGKLEWINGSLEILKWWTSPDSKINFGIEYKFDLGDKGTFYAKSIAPDQRVLVEGIENYEGGVDVFETIEMLPENICGYGNIECVGWPSSKQKVDYAMKFIGYDGLSESEKKIISKELEIDVSSLSTIFVLFFIILSITFGYIIHKKRGNKNEALQFIFSYSIGILSTIVLYIILFFIFKILGCSVSHTCALGKWNGCLYSCPS